MNSPLSIGFVVYKKNFVNKDKKSLWDLLRQYGNLQNIINVIKTPYKVITSRNIHEGELENMFEIRPGARQGCLLSPLLPLLIIYNSCRLSYEKKKKSVYFIIQVYVKVNGF